MGLHGLMLTELHCKSMETREQRIEHFRKETRNISKTTTVLLWLFGLTTIALFAASFIVPPTGEISPSVLKAAALLFAFATLAEAREAIREGLGVKLTHGHTTIEVHDLDGPDPGHGHGQAPVHHQHESETEIGDESE